MTKPIPKLRKVKSVGAAELEVIWDNERKDRINLAGWIATGGPILAPLEDPATFKHARLGDFGRSVVWGDDDGDLAIDSYHLGRIAHAQRPVTHIELSAWQAANNFTNAEAAKLVGVASSTWSAYKKGDAQIPPAVETVILASEADPVIIHARFRPLKGKAGRPAKA